MLKHLIQRLRERLSDSNHTASSDLDVDLDAHIEVIRRTEAAHDIDLGKRIHRFWCRGLELRLDRDVMGLYRVTVNEGSERRYSFTIRCEPGDYDTLRACYEEIIALLGDPPDPAHLPDHDRMTGHYYGSSG